MSNQGKYLIGLDRQGNPVYGPHPLRSFSPKVSMDPKVHYTTASGVYEAIALQIRKPKKHARRYNTKTTNAANSIIQSVLDDLAT